MAIPPDATREHIALTLASLVGKDRDPLVMNTLLALADGVLLKQTISQPRQPMRIPTTACPDRLKLYAEAGEVLA